MLQQGRDTYSKYRRRFDYYSSLKNANPTARYKFKEGFIGKPFYALSSTLFEN